MMMVFILANLNNLSTYLNKKHTLESTPIDNKIHRPYYSQQTPSKHFYLALHLKHFKKKTEIHSYF